MTKSKELQTLINDLHAFRISSPTTFYHPPILDDAAQVIENLLQELERIGFAESSLEEVMDALAVSDDLGKKLKRMEGKR